MEDDFDTKNYKQIYINAHGGSPVSRKSLTIDGHNYRKDKLSSYIGNVPDKTLLVTCTPPNHYFTVDKKEHIVKQIISNLVKEKLNYLIKLKDISNNYDYVFQFLKEIQIYEPSQKFYNQEIIFENTKINNILELNENDYQIYKPQTRKFFGCDSRYKINVDTRTNKNIDPIIDKNKTYLHPWNLNYIPYSLQGLLNFIKKDYIDSWVIIYVFICNPRGNPCNTSYPLYSKINEMYENGKKTCQKYRDNYYYVNKIRKTKKKEIEKSLVNSLPLTKNYDAFEYDPLDLSSIYNTDWYTKHREKTDLEIRTKIKHLRKLNITKLNKIRKNEF